MTDGRFSRTELLLGAEAMEKLRAALGEEACPW